jgi:hypothetical protein
MRIHLLAGDGVVALCIWFSDIRRFVLWHKCKMCHHPYIYDILSLHLLLIVYIFFILSLHLLLIVCIFFILSLHLLIIVYIFFILSLHVLWVLSLLFSSGTFSGHFHCYFLRVLSLGTLSGYLPRDYAL